MTDTYKAPCRLCGSRVADEHYRVNGRSYLRCSECDLVFMAAEYWLSEAEERRRYELHQNDLREPGYRAHLNAAIEPLMRRLAPGAEGLDFGCGPIAAASTILSGHGYPMTAFDPFFAPDEEALGRRYDFVLCIEVAEHLRHPGRELALLHRVLKPSGLLCLATLLLSADTRFDDWWYARDPTHVSFYSRSTFAWICKKADWKLEESSERIHLLRRGS